MRAEGQRAQANTGTLGNIHNDQEVTEMNKLHCFTGCTDAHRLHDFLDALGEACRERNEEPRRPEETTPTRDSRSADGNQLTVFESSEFGNLGVMIIDGKPYFPATDCARILGYEKPHNAIAAHCRYSLKRGVPHPQSPGKTIQRIFIPEGDLYRLIIRSRLPAAERFEAWVMDEVLPSIRRTGGYIAGEERMSDSTLKRAADRVLRKKLREKAPVGEDMLGGLVDRMCSGEPLSWNFAQMLDKLLGRYAKALCMNNRQWARNDLYKQLYDHCGISLWERKRLASEANGEMWTRPLYSFLKAEEQSLALLFAVAMCLFQKVDVSDLIRQYCDLSVAQ